ncbi:MerR family transcriptional regulator [Actinocorallia longicatena]|uniref:MerR family transcriptional regulator n=1 Tax=Actinocorallia longicatena TaxID=111803 RepID=A0ABP6Q846_9ACTN
MQYYSPGETAERSGFTLDTLRYYDKLGLLGELSRTPGGRRRFTDDDLSWLNMLRCLRETGMPIAELQHFAELCRDPDSVPARIALLESHEAQVEAQMDRLRTQQSHIQGKIAHYRSTRTTEKPAPCSGTGF